MTTFSPTPDRVPVDAEQLVQAGIRGFDASWRVVTDTPEKMEELGGVVVRVTRIGGVGLPGFYDRARVDIDVFASSRGAASTVCRTIAAKLPTLRGKTGGAAVITDVQQELGVSWRPYSNSSLRRFGFTAVVSFHS